MKTVKHSYMDGMRCSDCAADGRGPQLLEWRLFSHSAYRVLEPISPGEVTLYPIVDHSRSEQSIGVTDLDKAYRARVSSQKQEKARGWCARARQQAS